MGKASSGAFLASAKPFLPSISPSPRMPRLAVPEAPADPRHRRMVAMRPGARGVTGMVAKGPEGEDKATRGHKYDRNTAPHQGTSSSCSSTVPEVSKTPHHPHLQKVLPQLSPSSDTFSWWPETPPGRAVWGEPGAPGQAVRCGSCKEPPGQGQGTRPTSFCPFLLPPPEAGAPLCTPAATTAFIKAPPPNQTPFVRETAATGSSAGAGAPVSPSQRSLSHPPSWCAAHLHPQVCARYLPGFAVLSAGWGAQSPFSRAVFLLQLWDFCVGVGAALSTWAAPSLHPPWA